MKDLSHRPSRRTPAMLLALGALVAALTFADRTQSGVLQLLAVRDRLFTRQASDTTWLHAAPAALRAAGYATDRPEDVAAFRRELVAGDPALEARLREAERAPDAVAKASILLDVLGGSTRDGVCGLRGTLVERVRQSRAGDGCCSDFARSFLALATVVGLPAREAISARHNFVGFYDARAGTWRFADPMFGMLARRADGGWASAADLAGAARQGRRLELVHVSHAPIAGQRPAEIAWLYEPAAFGSITYPAGNNVIAIDRLARRLSFLPRPVEQLIAYASGVRPKLVVLPMPPVPDAS